MPFSRLVISFSKTTQPIGPRLRTMIALDSARIAFSASSGESAPPAIITSSSVPTMRSQSGRMVLSF
jgi:hypothetical protein